MSNLSKKRRDTMIAALDVLKEQSSEEQQRVLNEIKNELTNKKYGLIWEEHEEVVDLELKDKIPVFIEDKNRKIIGDTKLDYNFLLEGDNLHSLYLLEKTHKGKIDVIYIDPPYNTGNNDFIYNDSIVGEEDTFRHSKWLSFMNKRLNIAKNLLADGGIIYISIDDNENASLKMLCDEIFDRNNNLGIFVVQSTPNARDYGHVGKQHEYMIMYSKNKDMVMTNKLPDITKKFKYEDTIGEFNIHPLYNSNENFDNINRPNLFYPFYLDTNSKDENGFYEISLERTNSSCIEVFPPKSLKNNVQFVWRWGKEKSLHNINKEIIGYKTGSDYRIVQKMRHTEKIIRSILNDSGYTSRKGTAEVESIFGEKIFSFPKPKQLIKDILLVGTSEQSIVLDFFAGSGTTGHAVMELNKEDGGNRKFILCTNNENNICEEVTYQRLKTVIIGRRNDGSEYDEPIASNLKYFKTEWIDKNSSFLEDELCNRIHEMIELENHIEIDKEEFVILMSEHDAEQYLNDSSKYSLIKKVWFREDILFTNEQQEILSKLVTQKIPRNYFDIELKEGGYYD